MLDGTMTGTIFGGIIGFLGALFPEVLQLIRDWMGVKTGTVGTNGSVVADHEDADQPYVKSDYEDGRGAEEQADLPLTFTLLDFMRASVRPVITYVFFGFFVYVKCVIMWHALSVDHAKATELLPILWDDGTETLFAAILSFWFGSRMMARFRRK